MSNRVEPCSRSPKLATALMLSRKRCGLRPATNAAAASDGGIVGGMAVSEPEPPPASPPGGAGSSAGEPASATVGPGPGGPAVSSAPVDPAAPLAPPEPPGVVPGMPASLFDDPPE